jgi:hypothetical protein
VDYGVVFVLLLQQWETARFWYLEADTTDAIDAGRDTHRPMET